MNNKRVIIAFVIGFTFLLALVGLEMYKPIGLPLPYRLLVSIVIGCFAYSIVWTWKTKD